ncbi:CPBP family intramembrane glutamic endopeptidase [Gaetbulibacter saemankumensis]|uniref:CPBP family intramembrane glutamic endopeptidase n=1 Tax=Gaetbulibacter saemankumensis TaxID=311208 RepID=UPI00041D9112|nr:CPBP family intramembrane glutamic endopeptidase [Gaetbulibacter saemankumensis]
MKSAYYKSVEFFIIYILFPIGLILPLPVWLKIGYCTFGFAYILYILLKVENIRLNFSKKVLWPVFWKETMLKFVAISIITGSYVYLTQREMLFHVVISKPKLWSIILIVYSLFSVYPQELIFRTFYFKRYKDLIQNDNLCLFLNGIVFSLAHLIFNNALVSVITFFGGLIFARTYQKSESTIMVSIEHAIYGCWLFTVGMGGMLGFPV